MNSWLEYTFSGGQFFYQLPSWVNPLVRPTEARAELRKMTVQGNVHSPFLLSSPPSPNLHPEQCNAQNEHARVNQGLYLKVGYAKPLANNICWNNVDSPKNMRHSGILGAMFYPFQLHWSPLVRSAFCPEKVDLQAGWPYIRVITHYQCPAF